jgi:hypothetical protein
MTDQPNPNVPNTTPVADNPAPAGSSAGAATLDVGAAEKPRQSLSALISFISGALVCVPFGTGILAVAAGAVGLVRTADPLKKGRWMAVAGILLGLGNIVVSTILFGGLLMAWAFAPTLKPHEVTRDFAIALNTHDLKTAEKLAPRMSNLNDLSNLMQRGGKYESMTYTTTDISKTSCRVNAVVTLDRGTANVDANLLNSGGWKIVEVDIQARYRVTR